MKAWQVVAATIRARWRAAFWAASLWLLAALLFTPSAQALAIERWETASGMRVLYALSPTLPMLDVRLIFDAGAARDGDRGGLARLTSEGLRLGTKTMDADLLAKRLEAVGAQFGASSARDTAIVSLRTLTEPDWLAEAIATFTELLAAPAFPEEGLARERRQMLRVLQGERQEPGAVAGRRLFELMYRDHPYANAPSGRDDSIPTLTRDEVLAFFQEFYAAGNAVLALTGAISRAEAEALAERIAAALPKGGRAPALPPVPPLAGPVSERIAFPSEQAHIHIGAPALRRGDPDYYAFSVANHAFGGGGFISRLFEEVRAKRGLAYSVFSFVLPMAAEGPFRIGMQTGADRVNEALAVLNHELMRLHREGLEAEELERSRANISGGFPLRLASNRDIVEHLGMIGFYDLPPDFLAAYKKRVEAVTAAQVHAAIQRRIAPHAMVTVVVGGTE